MKLSVKTVTRIVIIGIAALLVAAICILPFNRGIGNLLICLGILLCFVWIFGLQLSLVLIFRRRKRVRRQDY
ncbi:MAG: hypothetical protein V1668_01475 [Patescibacteria group bacterium]